MYAVTQATGGDLIAREEKNGIRAASEDRQTRTLEDGRSASEARPTERGAHQVHVYGEKQHDQDENLANAIAARREPRFVGRPPSFQSR